MDTRCLKIAAATTVLLLPVAAPCQEDTTKPATSHPLDRDRTGIRWVHPFKVAQAKAKREGRLLLFLPLAGGTNHKGDW